MVSPENIHPSNTQTEQVLFICLGTHTHTCMHTHTCTKQLRKRGHEFERGGVVHGRIWRGERERENYVLFMGW